ncbi:cupredoxin domain-containing protein [Kineosporia sp. R_H_3]|uniref:cupredoxin domain-containing protein n=1 Tax=Kineosporia sp. R_H_3 TaxID=1961848 RepID=UPI000B4BD7CA|nr:cupredoxin domain-containing protein [Kineosporia sp. R_H_3]
MTIASVVPTSSPRRAGATAAALLAVLALAGCSSKPVDVTVAVTGTDTTCTPAADVAEPGVIQFDFTNNGTKESELYLLDAKGGTVGEREDVGPGTTAKLVVEVEAGSYTLQCKPGQKGDGIKAPFTVTG